MSLLTLDEKKNLKKYVEKNFMLLHFLENNPNKKQSKFYEDYEIFKVATNNERFFCLGGTSADFIKAFELGLILNILPVEANVEHIHIGLQEVLNQRKKKRENEKNIIKVRKQFLRDIRTSAKRRLKELNKNPNKRSKLQ